MNINNNRWALNIVKRYSIRVRKKVTGKSFLALVPYAHLMRHRRDDQGEYDSKNTSSRPKKEVELEYSMDNMVKLKVRRGSQFEAGDELRVDHSNVAMTKHSYSDAETMIRFHHVSAAEEPNPNNFIRIILPGCKDQNDDLYSHIDHMDEWRQMLHLPLKLRELHEAADQLMLYGEEWVGWRSSISRRAFANDRNSSLYTLSFPALFFPHVPINRTRRRSAPSKMQTS